MSNYRFNYIVTIHNKEHLILQVLTSIIKCCGSNSYIYLVLDGCTDQSEEKIDSHIMKFPTNIITKIYENNVHEILSKNAGLRIANQQEKGFNILLQDDVIILDQELELKIIKIYEYIGYENIGSLAFRHGVSIGLNENEKSVYEKDLIESCFGVGMCSNPLPPNTLIKKMIGIGSPECISCHVINILGVMDENLSPYTYDNHDYSLRCLQKGFKNYVFSLNFQSDVKWGGMRTNPHPEAQVVMARNRNYLYKKYSSFIQTINEKEYIDQKYFEIPGILTYKKDRLVELKKYKKRRGENFPKNSLKVKLYLFIKKVYKEINKNKQPPNSSIILTDPKYNRRLTFSQAIEIFPTRNELYLYMLRFYNQFCPELIKEHRKFYSIDGRGFGEDAFHAMWWLLLKEFKPIKCMEIGIYRGQVISLWSLISKINEQPIETNGISPFLSVGDSVSMYNNDIDYYSDVLNFFKLFKLPSPKLLKAYSTDSLAKQFIEGESWDLIYIDGSHDYEVVLQDYNICKSNLKTNGLLVIDDSSLETDYVPYSFSFAGHPGPSKVVKEFAMKEMKFIGAIGHNNIFQKI